MAHLIRQREVKGRGQGQAESDAGRAHRSRQRDEGLQAAKQPCCRRPTCRWSPPSCEYGASTRLKLARDLALSSESDRSSCITCPSHPRQVPEVPLCFPFRVAPPVSLAVLCFLPVHRRPQKREERKIPPATHATPRPKPNDGFHSQRFFATVEKPSRTAQMEHDCLARWETEGQHQDASTHFCLPSKYAIPS